MSYDDVYGHVPKSVHDIGFSLTMVFSRFLHRSSCLSFLFFPASLKCIDNMAAEQGPRRSTRINHNYTDYSMQEDVLTHTTSSGDERQGRRTPTTTNHNGPMLDASALSGSDNVLEHLERLCQSIQL